MNPELEHLQAMVGQTVVVDVAAQFVYLGTLSSVVPGFLVLADADVHDLRDSDATREVYVQTSAQDGIRRNRREVSLRLDVVLSISRLADVVDH